MDKLKKGKVNNNVRQYRRLIDLTQEEFAQKIGVHRQTIIAIEKQKYEPSIGVVLMISLVLKEPIEKLFFFHEE
ncbi:helix-turn-helix transcriptional regulator [Lysinibacillus sp. FJAT-14222]|uniref:helix-turn-helix transcriptional regulator n=1 Tax=Lysinibacillus sp. FJAT-14222 TaxID=1932366 RepID=UPI001F517A52|nr:helix-turn-helix transcriptional regulator [Lysinibacillus sp. FJAT-14222]